MTLLACTANQKAQIHELPRPVTDTSVDRQLSRNGQNLEFIGKPGPRAMQYELLMAISTIRQQR